MASRTLPLAVSQSLLFDLPVSEPPVVGTLEAVVDMCLSSKLCYVNDASQHAMGHVLAMLYTRFPNARILVFSRGFCL
jgi:hypothetical protein